MLEAPDGHVERRPRERVVEDAADLAAADEIAVASPRLAALVFGPADFMASLGMRSLSIGSQPEGYAGGDAFHYAHMRILVAARAAGLQAIDQIGAVNAAFSPGHARRGCPRPGGRAGEEPGRARDLRQGRCSRHSPIALADRASPAFTAAPGRAS